MKKPIVLTILDGYGLREETHGNAVKLANNEVFNMLWDRYPHTQLIASGQEVGLPKGQMGNSEVGHMNIGAGRIIYQDLAKITKEIEEGDFFSKTELVSAIENCKKNGTKLHVMGLLSDGGVHSHNRHLYAILELAKRKDFEDVYVHCFLDGRDTPPASAESYIIQLQDKMAEKEISNIIKLQIEAGKATPAPPVGPALGSSGVNIMQFVKEFNDRTANQPGMIIPVVITVYKDKSFEFITKVPPVAVLIKKAIKIQKGSGKPNKEKVAKITKEQVRQIAETKMPDLNAASIETAMSMVMGTARSMGVVVED